MQIHLNGEKRQVPDQWTIADLLQELKIENRYCAVERNRDVVPREKHATTLLNIDDVIEVVTLVGGG
ncbi:MAG: sulfur carrier protein ThiS [Planctomycetaceae bacterium]|nr:sulfur carrier protein ThiS [Planctomycetaceae bacterium]